MDSLNMNAGGGLGSAGSAAGTVKNQIANAVADMVRQAVLGMLGNAGS